MVNNLLISFGSVWSILVAIAILLAMITIHEFGHYIVGKILGFGITEFSIGMGPAIFKHKKKDGEKFSIRMLPIGGYCAFVGEEDEGNTENSFNKKAPWKRILVLLAGPLMNYILALVLILIYMFAYGQSMVQVGIARPGDYLGQEYVEMSLQQDDVIVAIQKGNRLINIYTTNDLIKATNHHSMGDVLYCKIIRDGNTLDELVPVKLRADIECRSLLDSAKVFASLGYGSAVGLTVSNELDALESENTLKSGDYVLKANDNEDYYQCTFLYDIDMVVDYVKVQVENGNPVSFWVSREGSRLVVDVDTSAVSETDLNSANKILEKIGVLSFDYTYYTGSTYAKLGFFATIGHSFEYSVKIGGTILKSLGELITGRIGIRSVGGTVTTIAAASQLISYGFDYALEIAAFIGVNLAVFNLLPIPALDGSKIVFCTIEWIRKKPINRKVEAVIHLVGFILILAFAIMVDLLQFV